MIADRAVMVGGCYTYNSSLFAFFTDPGAHSKGPPR